MMAGRRLGEWRQNSSSPQNEAFALGMEYGYVRHVGRALTPRHQESPVIVPQLLSFVQGHTFAFP